MLRTVRSFAKQFAVSAFVLTAGVSLSANAQNVNPQLLPATAKLLAGGGTIALTAGATCPVSGKTSTDAYGDGCLATEVQLASPRYAIADSAGNVFFTDYTPGLVHRIDASTGVMTLIAGGATSSPALGAACGTGVSVDAKGDGCLSNLVSLNDTMGMAFDASGNLYVVEGGGSTSSTAAVRKIAATGGFVSAPGVITTVAGSTTAKTNGYYTNQGGTTNATVGSSSGLLNFPADLSFDKAGNLYIADEGNEAILVANLTSTTQTIQTISIPAGTIAKIAGYGVYQSKATTGECPNGVYVSSTSRGGCYFAAFPTAAAAAATTPLDGPYGVGVDPNNGNVYFPNEFTDNIGKIAAGQLTNEGGIAGSYKQYALGSVPSGAAGSFAVGTLYSTVVDASSNVYFGDAFNGVVWRVDGASNTMTPVAGGAATVCSGATDTFGDGCLATQAQFGRGTGTSFASAGTWGVKVDGYSDLYVGDSVNNVIRIVASGAWFGATGSSATDTLLIHYANGDGPATSTPYAITAGSTIFTVGTPGACTSNTDGTMDCLVPVTAKPSTAGAYSGTLTVTSKLNKTAALPLAGIYVPSRITTTTVKLNVTTTCSGSTTYSASTPISVIATVAAAGTATGSVQFYNGSTPIGAAVPLTSAGTATLTQTFPVGAYTIKAIYSGDANFNSSTTATPVTFTTSTASFSIAPGTTNLSTVKQGGTALYSFTVPTTLYSGTITFSCAGLPAGASCVFSPTTLTGTGCTNTTNPPVVGLTIFTSVKAQQSGFGGRWMMITGFLLALGLGLTRRRMPAQFARISMALALLVATAGLAACNTSSIGNPSTPTGSSTITVTGAGSDGSVASTTVTLVVQ